MKNVKSEIILLTVVLVIAIGLNIASVVQFYVNGHPINWGTFVCCYACLTIAFSDAYRRIKDEKKKLEEEKKENE